MLVKGAPGVDITNDTKSQKHDIVNMQKKKNWLYSVL